MVKQDNETRILNAVIELVGELGYKGMTTRMIADRAGVNEVTLFRKFGAKSVLFEKAVKHVQNQTAESIQNLNTEPTGNSREDLSSLILSLMNFLEEKRDTVSAVMFEAAREPTAMELGRSIISSISSQIGELMAKMPNWRTLLPAENETAVSVTVSFIFTRIMVREKLQQGIFNRDNRKQAVSSFLNLLYSGFNKVSPSGGFRGMDL